MMDGRLFTFLAQAVAPAATPGLDESAVISRGIQLTQLGIIYVGAALFVYLVLLLLGRSLKKRFGLPLGWGYHLFAVSMALLLPSLHPQINLPVESSIDAAAVLTATFVAISILRHYLIGQEQGENAQGTKVPKFLVHILSIIAVLIALAIVLQVFYKVEVPGLLAGAGIASIVLGLALQDTLGNIFSGFAIYFGGQFKSGDWLKVGEQHAEIMEINWRSTRLRTNDNVYLDIPNGSITKETVYNYTHPTTLHAMRFEIGLDYEASPEKVRSVLKEAALAVSTVSKEPPPKVYLLDFAASSITYQLKFWMEDHRTYSDTLSDIKINLWYALRRHNISIPYPIQLETHFEMPDRSKERKDLAREALSKVFFAECLDAEQIAHLLDHAKHVEFGTHEALIKQGEAGDSMYILMRGSADVVVNVGGSPRVVATISAGDCIGEMSLLTGEKRSATIVAKEETCAVEIDKTTLAPLIAASPTLVDALSDLLAARRLQNEGVLAETLSAHQLREKCQDYRSGFITKLKSFFAL